MQPRPAHPCGVSVVPAAGLAALAGGVRASAWAWAAGAGLGTDGFHQWEEHEAGHWVPARMECVQQKAF